MMNRYQIYLDPPVVQTFDQLAWQLELSRSHLIRDSLDRLIREYTKVLTAGKNLTLKSNPLLKMIGIGKSSTGRIAQDVNSIYGQKKINH